MFCMTLDRPPVFPAPRRPRGLHRAAEAPGRISVLGILPFGDGDAAALEVADNVALGGDDVYGRDLDGAFADGDATFAASASIDVDYDAS